MPEKIERQLKYNSVRSKINPECNELLFLIVDENREIEVKKMKLFEFFKPIEEEYKGLSGGIPGGNGLRYELIRFDSKVIIDISYLKKMSKIKVQRDLRLYSRENPDGLEKYVAGLFG